MAISLKAMLKQYGISNDIAEALERKGNEIDEKAAHEKAAAMTRMMINEVLRDRKQFEQSQNAVKEPRKIIIDEG